MHIVFVDAVTDPVHPGAGGLSDIHWHLARELVGAGERVTIIGPYQRNAANPNPNVAFLPLTQAVFRRDNIATYAMRALRLAHAAKNLDHVDVYHSPDSLTSAALALYGLGPRVVWHGNANVHLFSQYGIPWDKSMYLLMRTATAFASKRISRVVALGPSVVPWWERSGFLHERICVIPNGIDLSADTPSQGTAQWHNPEIWRQSKYHLLYVGRLAAEKRGYFELIEAVADLSSELSVSLVIVGDGPQRGKLEDLLRQRNLTDIVCCIGHQPHEVVSQAYKHADLVILPTYADMMPRVMLEAWAAGVPFMATAIGAIPDYLRDNQNGFLLASLEREYLRSRLREVLKNPEQRARVAEGGQLTARELTWSHSASKFRDVYRSVIAEQQEVNRPPYLRSRVSRGGDTVNRDPEGE